MEEETSRRSNRRSVPGMAILVIFVALLFLVGPYLVPIEVPALSKLMLSGFGVFLLVVSMTVITITRLYHRTAADEAFVRTGMGGPKVVLDGGSLVIPVVHQVIWLSLRTMRFEVTRDGPGALLTGDNLRADITCEFFVKVPKTEQAVKDAATSLGTAALDRDGILQVVEKKLESAIRQVAAEMDLEQLLRNRAVFIEKIMEHVRPDIEKNGLALENVTISRLDQTPASALRSDNVFDAQGRRKIAEITTAQRVATTRIELEGEQQIQAQTTTTQEFVAQQKVAQAKALATQERDVAVARATASQEADTAAAQQDQIAKVAGIERDRAVNLAEVEQAQAVEVAGQQREQAVRTAEIAKDQATEVADRERQIAVAEAERKRATAQAQQLEAEATREANNQQVVTVQAVATADREKQKTVIAAQADAEKQRVAQEVTANVAAYTQVKTAEGEQKAAELKAEARGGPRLKRKQMPANSKRRVSRPYRWYRSRLTANASGSRVPGPQCSASSSRTSRHSSPSPRSCNSPLPRSRLTKKLGLPKPRRWVLPSPR